MTRTPAQEIVARYVDASRETGREPERRRVGHVAREVGALLRAGVDPALVALCADWLAVVDRHPAALPELVEAERGRRRRDPETHDADEGRQEGGRP